MLQLTTYESFVSPNVVDSVFREKDFLCWGWLLVLREFLGLRRRIFLISESNPWNGLTWQKTECNKTTVIQWILLHLVKIAYGCHNFMLPFVFFQFQDLKHFFVGRNWIEGGGITEAHPFRKFKLRELRLYLWYPFRKLIGIKIRKGPADQYQTY